MKEFEEKIKVKKEQYNAILDKMNKILEIGIVEVRGLTEVENTEVKELRAKADNLKLEIEINKLHIYKIIQLIAESDEDLVLDIDIYDNKVFVNDIGIMIFDTNKKETVEAITMCFELVKDIREQTNNVTREMGREAKEKFIKLGIEVLWLEPQMHRYKYENVWFIDRLKNIFKNK